MTPGVQNIDSSAYLPPPPSVSSSSPDAKAAGSAGRPASDPQAAQTPGEPSEFQSELQQQDAGTQETKSDRLPKTESGKTGKKRETRPDDSNLSALTPVPVAEPQKQILPFALTLPQPQENAKLDVAATLDKYAQTNGIPPEPVSATPDPSKASLLASALPLAPQLPVQKAATESEDSSSEEEDPNQTLTSARPGESSNRQPVSRIELNLPAIPAEPVDSAPSSPSALAFAARLAAAPQKADQPGAANAASIPALSGSQTADRIPVRYAATAQILPNAGTDTKGLKKDPGAVIDQPVRADARTDSRTDLVLPRLESVSQEASASGSAAPQPAAPAARTEPVIEPPAAPPTSNHDIRVRVPDNNGGSTQVRFVESGGEVRVSVRTSDEGLAQSLRTHLNDLTQRLSDGGMPAEIWKPASNAASSQNDQHQPHPDGRGPGGQGSGGQGGQQDRQQKRPAWLEEMEASLHAESN